MWYEAEKKFSAPRPKIPANIQKGVGHLTNKSNDDPLTIIAITKTYLDATCTDQVQSRLYHFHHQCRSTFGEHEKL